MGISLPALTICFAIVCLAGCVPAQSWDKDFAGMQYRVYARHAIAPGSTISENDLVLSPYVDGLSVSNSFTSVEAVAGRKNWAGLSAGDLVREPGLKAIDRNVVANSPVVIAALQKARVRSLVVAGDELYAALPELIKDVGHYDVAYKERVHWAITSIDPEGVHTIPLLEKQLKNSILVRGTVELLDEFGSARARHLSFRTKKHWGISR